MIPIEKTGSTSVSAEVKIHHTSSASAMEALNLQRSKSGADMKAPEVSAPVYPVEVKHNFPPEPPVREPPFTKDDLKFPVLGVEGKHSYKEKTPAPLDEKHLAGPIFDVQRDHS